jgi:hypothetical protein
MNYIKLVKEIPNIKNIRTSQLERQENIDKELKKIMNTCPNIISEYLLFQRYLSRIQQKEMINSGIFEMFPTIYKHFDENNIIFNNFDKILKCDNKCECIKNLIKYNI